MALEIEGSNPFAHPTGLLNGFFSKGWSDKINLPILSYHDITVCPSERELKRWWSRAHV